MAGAPPYYDWIAHHAGRRPHQLAIHDLQTARKFSYADLHHRTNRLAAALAALGIGKGDRIALLAPNCAEYFELQFACGRLGAIMLPLNWRLTVPELEYILGDSTPKLLIHDSSFSEAASKLAHLCKLPHLLEIDHERPDGAYERALAGGHAVPDPIALTHDDIGMVMYTSGTTGHPKGAIITHGMVFWNCVNLGIPALISPLTVQLVVLPLFHTGGLNCYANPVLHAGGTILVMRSFDPGLALDYISDPALGITHFFAVPAPYQFMMQHPNFQSADLTRLQIAGVGGAPCALAILEGWTERGVPLVQGWGMTETSPAGTMLDASDAIRKLGSAGKAMMHTAIRIVDEAGHDVARGVVGELLIKGPNITPGYWNKPEATANAFSDGWLHTGDAARMDDEGFIYIVDRWKDMYISGGENVYPAEVENVLFQLPQVADAAIIGIPNERWGEVGLAIIVRKADQPLEEADVIRHCLGKLAKFKVPQSIAFVEALPRNATGKVLKRELRVQFVGADKPAIT
ncbi:fatty-acyl-CoA synthase [Enhydrobacter aerosaccus]|uniref:3-methylmercaptopropionyl-CoA ligase n=1 Tax=Enhydrobacter aerosaccus TaxID=225324 RepID=A0A1T4KU21_9HYPH|nr:long-chain fatty acid--CoA ligase [Enhydrobacter aerosaccus]SJZ45860.1 fatty-acyl-CoA synthase [Enhydrobacter aerosaccus]